jgi:hypothetical protein
MKPYYAVQDLRSYSNKDLNILKNYYNIPNHISGNNLIWLIAVNIHSTKMNMAPDKVWIKYNNKLVPLLSPNLLDNESYKKLFLDADPDPKKKNLEWMITSFISGGYNISELPQLKLAIIKFNKLREKGTFKDNLVDFGGLHGFIRNNKQFSSLKDFLNKYKDIEEPDYKFNIITDNSDVKIIQPLNESASCKYGANTKWCTAGKENNSFKQYYKDGELYIIIPKNPSHKGEKYQLYIKSNYINEKENKKIILMDENDISVNINELLKIHPYLNTNSLLKYILLRLKGLKMSYEEYIKSDENLLYEIRDGKHEFKDITYWYLDGILHRLDGPAIKRIDGQNEWYKEGKLHRLDGPAIETTDGQNEWYKEGQLHRLDGPAIYSLNGTKEWYKEGKLHRLDGPAIERMDGTKEWYKEGQLHRVDGPAIENINGTKEWYKEGQLHRLDGPAIENINGSKEWYKDGKKHRDDGPAIEYDYIKYWYKNGKKHREDGPAVVSSGYTEWWLNGKLHRLDGPAIESIYGPKKWYKYGKKHRDDGPAIEWGKDKKWYKDGKKHREDGPAVEKENGKKEWWINGIKIK